ncbi:MAG: tetrahydrodipicolinate N-succinyltransferase N-terminal domain-containing protein [Campylobacter sp.]|nr:tetrahydrodipicolinate N-succinyltransferase N-terminal domain-containing protein [Campylobacter sp.]
MKTLNFGEICANIRASNGYKDPEIFGILNENEILLANKNSNFLSAAGLFWAIKQRALDFDFKASQLVLDFDKDLALKAWELFCVFENELDSHPNAAVIKQLIKTNLNAKIVFIYESQKAKHPLALRLIKHFTTKGQQ